MCPRDTFMNVHIKYVLRTQISIYYMCPMGTSISISSNHKCICYKMLHLLTEYMY